MSSTGELAAVKQVLAHPQALAQCARWLDAHLPDAERVPVSSNAEGARQSAHDKIGSMAAIAAKVAADRYGLRIARADIQDNPNNRTRFAVIGNYACEPSGDDQTSLILSVPDRAGAMHQLIEPLARHGVSMKRFESRPALGKQWEYFFYIDLLGHPNESSVSAALEEIKASAAFYKVVGAYPRSAES